MAARGHGELLPRNKSGLAFDVQRQSQPVFHFLKPGRAAHADGKTEFWPRCTASAEMRQAFYGAGLEVVRLPSSGSTWEHKALCGAAGHMLQAPPQLHWAGQGTYRYCNCPCPSLVVPDGPAISA